MVPSLCRLATIVVSLFMRRRLSRRNDPNAITALCINDCQNDIVNSPRHDVPDLAGHTVQITSLTGKRIVEHTPRRLEANAVFYEIAFRFASVPFKLIFNHMIRRTRSFVQAVATSAKFVASTANLLMRHSKIL